MSRTSALELGAEAADESASVKAAQARQRAAETKKLRSTQRLFKSAVELAAGPIRDTQLTVAAICNNAGVSTTALYKHYPDGLAQILGQVLNLSLSRASRLIDVDVAREKSDPEFRVMITVYRVVSELFQYPNLLNVDLQGERVPREWVEMVAKPLLDLVVMADHCAPMRFPATVIAEYHAEAILGMMRREYGHGLDYVAELVCHQMLPMLGLADEEFSHKWENVVHRLSLD